MDVITRQFLKMISINKFYILVIKKVERIQPLPELIFQF